MQTIPLINYKELRKSNPQTARQAVIQYLQSLDNNISATAKTFGINRPVVYGIINKYRQGDLKDRPKIPHHQPRKTPLNIETKVIEIKIKTRLGPKRLSRYLKRYESLYVPPGTIRHILRIHKEQIKDFIAPNKRKKEKREFGGQSWLKVRELRKLLVGFALNLIQGIRVILRRTHHLNGHIGLTMRSESV